MESLRQRALALALASVGLAAPSATAQSLGPDFADDYRIEALPAVPGLVDLYGGAVFRDGDPSKLLIVSGCCSADVDIYEIEVTRDARGFVDGFTGTASFVASAPFADGGLRFGPGGVLFYTTWDTNTLGQIKPGSSAADKVIDLTALGITVSTGGLSITPSGFPGAGKVRLTSFNSGEWYSADLVPDGSGTFDLANIVNEATLPPTGGVESIIYVDTSSAAFDVQSVLVNQWLLGQVVAYEIDANGDPDPNANRVFIEAITATGSVLDPVSGAWLFPDYFGTTIYQVRPSEVRFYCTAKAGLSCGTPVLDAIGNSAAGAPSGFVLSASPARGQRSGLVLYGTQGPAAIPFQGGLLCVSPTPLRRASGLNSGGTQGACDGVFSLDFNCFASGNGCASGTPDPLLMMPGQQVNAQFWGRDSVATGSFLSAGVEFSM